MTGDRDVTHPEDAIQAPDVQPEYAAEFVGEPDGFERTWVPHRMVYLGNDKRDRTHENVCVFCAAPEKSDADGLIVYRGETCYVVMNLYPYNTGHLLICPYRHIATYDQCDEAEILEMGTLTQRAMRILKRQSGVAGFNIGMNQGQVAGAGVAGHLHEHIVPRWANDANFMPIIARTKPMPRLLGEQRAELARWWQESLERD
ncbi:HIT family protein [Gulosibacter bifidus]|uniref:HIT family protein n=1 Tax=Gulosibacter bifidus TaxID=272239 RepID=A0ABW5RFG0_9MICO|nr:HIT domain-containing protein [Gulosibacter bifidus]